MRTFSKGRTAGIIAGTALLSACGGSQAQIATPLSIAQHDATESKTFQYTGGAQTFTVPAGVTHITVAAYGAGTPSFNDGPTGPFSVGNTGGFVQAVIPATPGENLTIYVGGSGQFSSGANGGHGGFNGGGSGGAGSYASLYANGGTGGGGASDVREGSDRLSSRVLVAGGAGGGGVGLGFYSAGEGAPGGGLT
ncbi:MAG: glycine-rich protein, partial [Candidatus Cybelea sp.]